MVTNSSAVALLQAVRKDQDEAIAMLEDMDADDLRLLAARLACFAGVMACKVAEMCNTSTEHVLNDMRAYYDNLEAGA